MSDLEYPPTAPGGDAYAEARSLPEAIALNRQFIRYERHWSRHHCEGMEDEHISYMRDMQRAEDILSAAVRVWNEEQAAVRQRIADRIRAEIPNAENYGIPQAVEEDDYTRMAC